MLISKNLHKEGTEVSIKTRSTPASLSFTGQVTKHITVKWTIGEVIYECVSYNIPSFWLISLNGFDFLLRDRENNL